jgi:hypothetical protein
MMSVEIRRKNRGVEEPNKGTKREKRKKKRR